MIHYRTGVPRQEEQDALIRAVVRELNLEPTPDSLIWVVKRPLRLQGVPYNYWIGTCQHVDGATYLLKVLLKELGTGKYSIPEATKQPYIKKEEDDSI